jgi:DNA-binding transcriptional regulator YbjK
VPPAVTSPPRTPRGRREELLEAVLRVLAREGPAGASHRAVAREAGVPLGSTTYYFASREEMLVAALRHAADREVARLRERVEELRGRRLGAAGWRREVVAWALEQMEPERAHLLVARHHLRVEAITRPQLRDAYRAWTAAALELAETALAACGSPDPAADAPVLVAALDGLQLNGLVLSDPQRRERAIRAAARRVMERLSGA